MKMHRHGLKMSEPSLKTRSTVTQRLKGDTWMARRAEILQRDQGLCQCTSCQSAPYPKAADEVDHITPLDQGGSNDPSNLQSMNRECHKAKTAAEARSRAMGLRL